MVRKWYNSNGAQAAEMLDVSDSTIREMSNGVVNMVPYDDSDAVTGSLDDPQIFGELSAENENMALGHIDLSVPVVNIQYFLGKKPILARLLGMSVKDLEKVIYYSCYVVTDPGETDMRYKQLLTEKEYVEAKQTQKVFQAELGAAAIDSLLKKDGIKERENIILHCVPVVPLCMRYAHVTKEESVCGQEHFVPLSLNALYTRVILRSSRITRLQGMECPEIILRNESRMLQEAVDALVSNGVRGLPICVDDNIPAYSLNELSEQITEPAPAKTKCPENGVERQAFLDTITAEWTYENANDIEGLELDSDDPRLAELSKLTDAVKGCVVPYAKEYIRLNYAQYKDAETSAVRYAVAKLATVCFSWYAMCDERKKKQKDEI